MENLEICKQTRKFAARSLYTVLKKLLNSNNPISEVTLRDAWLAEMRKNKNIFPNGWYMPPPHGIIMLFASDKNLARVNFTNARFEESWARDDIFLDTRNGLIFVYASPVDKDTGIIGDFQMMLYFGDKAEIKNYLKQLYQLPQEIFNDIEIGMKFSEITSMAEKIMKKKGMTNQIVSLMYKRTTNVVGHTIPGFYKEWSKSEKALLKKGEKEWTQIKDMISKKRVYIKDDEDIAVTPGMAFTIEPRPKMIDKSHLPTSLGFHTIAIFKEDREKELVTDFDQLFTLTGMDYMIEPMKKQKIDYVQSGVNYESLDPAKKLAQDAGRKTSVHLKNYGLEEMADTRGESAFVWKQKNTYMATVTESLGTKNLVADAMRKITGKTYYDNIAYDTVASALNDLTTVGAKPLVVYAFWAVGETNWFDDLERTTDLVSGWKQACDDAQATWGGGETPAYNGIVNPETIALGSSAVGIIPSEKRLLLDKKLKAGDRILLLKSSGINANGLSLSRAVAKKLPKGYATKLPSGTFYGEAILRKTNIYAALIQDLLNANIDLHYVSNITGHGLRKLMRARGNFTYLVDKIFEPQELFLFIQKHAGLSEYEMYDTYNMGQDYAIFLPEKDMKQAQKIVAKNGFESLDAGYIEKGERQVVIKPKNIIFKGETLKLR